MRGDYGPVGFLFFYMVKLQPCYFSMRRDYGPVDFLFFQAMKITDVVIFRD